MTLDEKRNIEAALTRAFVESNKDKLLEIAAFLAAKFSGHISSMDNFYLKGGNAFFILNKTAENHSDAPVGDYDFQFVPDKRAYDNWKDNITVIDNKIIEVLKETVEEHNSEFNTDCFKAENIIELLSDKIADKPKNIRINSQERVNGITRIGAGYMRKSYIEVAEEAMKQPDKRVDLRGERFNLEDFSKTCEPSIYVNYTIPGFILYRMVYKFKYTANIEGANEEFSLKSEIVDISVPRVGSGEVYMSQNGVITHFREKDGFNIPGWGYHLYENINLLQEIALGISGSKHKVKKREERLKTAAEALIKANGGAAGTFKDITVLLGETISEPYSDTESKEILGYYSAHIYSIKNDKTFKNIVGKIYKNCVNAYFSDLLQRLGDSIKWKALYEFKVTDIFTLTLSDIKNAAGALINSCSRCAVTQYISPFLGAGNDCACAFDYAEIGVDDNLYASLLELCKNKMTDRLNDFASVAAMTVNDDGSITVTMTVNKKAVTGAARVLYVIIRKQNVKITPQSRKKSASEMLSQCILESQRYSLTQVVQNNL